MNEKRKKVIMAIAAVMVAAILAIVAYYWYNNTYFVSTEDAKVSGDFVKLSTQISGKLVDTTFEEGEAVKRGQILGRQEMTTLPYSSLEQSIIRSSIDGVVLKKLANIGDQMAQGQTLAVIVDPTKLYVTANIEETSLNRISENQLVDVDVDQYKGKTLKGHVKTIGKAANSAFSLLPSSTSATFTKVVQKIPVKIEVEREGLSLLPGTNVIVKIHVR